MQCLSELPNIKQLLHYRSLSQRVQRPTSKLLDVVNKSNKPKPSKFGLKIASSSNGPTRLKHAAPTILELKSQSSVSAVSLSRVPYC